MVEEGKEVTEVGVANQNESNTNLTSYLIIIYTFIF